jgi:hypothetical protein
MNHIDDDILMKIALGLLEQGEAASLHEHLHECDDCRTRLACIRRDMELIGSLEPKIDSPIIPLPRARCLRIAVLFKAAALLLVGFVVGYGASRLSDDHIVSIVPHRMYVSPPRHAYTDFSQCESVDMVGDLFPETRSDTMPR